MSFSSLQPSADAPAVWAVQGQLLAEAERLLGVREPAKEIYQPQFATDGKGPRVINTPNLDGAFALLSANAAGYWPTLVFELAHETVHLLNPIVGHTNRLEEGIAVAFSLHAQDAISRDSISLQAYRDALTLVETLPGGPLEFGKEIRSIFGSLHGFTAVSLNQAFPSISTELSVRLSETCIPW